MSSTNKWLCALLKCANDKYMAFHSVSDTWLNNGHPSRGTTSHGAASVSGVVVGGGFAGSRKASFLGAAAAAVTLAVAAGVGFLAGIVVGVVVPFVSSAGASITSVVCAADGCSC